MELTKKDKLLIYNYIQKYATDYRKEKELNDELEEKVNFLLRLWKTAKENHLFTVFGDNLILKRPNFTVEKDIEVIRNACERAVYTNWDFYDNWRNMVEEFDFIPLGSLTGRECLASNYYDGEEFEITTPKGKVIQVQKGCRPVKMIGKILKAFNRLRGYETFRIEHSRVLNDKYMTGTLCLSIHPLDYMTMSDNDYDWGSCMSWREEGEHRMGTVEMMNSSTVVVGYLKGEEPMDLFEDGEAEWNNKKWRQLFIVDPKIILAVHAYPRKNDVMTQECLDWLRDLMIAAGYNYYPDIDIYKSGYRVTENYSIRYRFSNNFMYNDLYESHYCYVSSDIDTESKYTTHTVEYSGPAECLCCGEDLSWASPETNLHPTCLVCMHCGGYKYCLECGEIMYEDEEMCEDCRSATYEECDICGDYCSDITAVKIIHEKGETEKSGCMHVCSYCLDDERFIWNSHWQCYTIYWDNLTDEEKKNFENLIF